MKKNIKLVPLLILLSSVLVSSKGYSDDDFFDDGSDHVTKQTLGPKKLLSSTIPYPFYDVHRAIDGKVNNVMILNSGIASLEKRLNMISSAKKNIEVEYFIYSTDQSSRLITQALVAAAKRNVQVRMLIDKSGTVFELDEYYAKVLKEVGIEVRYYNAAPFIQISTINFRNHRKLISIDDKLAITGGRNIQDDYFDMSEEFNFIDRDIYIEGPMALTMRKTFDLFFNSAITEIPILPTRPADTLIADGYDEFYEEGETIDNSQAVNAYLKRYQEAKKIITSSEEDIKSRKIVAKVASPILDNLALNVCPELTYSTDRPGGTWWRRLVDKYSDDYRFLRKTLFDKAGAVDTKVVIASPYMINNGLSRDLMGDILDRNVQLDLYTNSLASTDAVYVAANLYKDILFWTQLDGVNIQLHNGKYMSTGSSTTYSKGVKTAKWGMHSKSHIYYDAKYSEIMVGTFNIDNRSSHYNTEMAIFCKGSKTVTRAVEESINRRAKNGFKVNSNLSAEDKDGNSVNILGADPSDQYLMYLISLPSWLLQWFL